ncbi:hypothetical protein CASFOL_026380 [Castilleja foliolosa]|uniref:Uncharacterized protein n=1 Tax=Castilleja foliolosa TaxID=1961234 RepID=A0ABD3CGX9_9LAMI
MDNTKVAFITIALISLAYITRVKSSTPAAPPCNFPAIYNFGDSNSDTGAMSAAFWPIPPPYGVNYFGKPAGRNSDGRLIIDFIDSIGANFRHGANFATTGSTIRTHNESIFDNGLSPELYHQGNKSVGKKLPRPQDFSKSLYTFDIGQNDIIAGFKSLTVARLQVLIPELVNQLGSTVTRLYEQGARAFWIHNIGPIGCLPLASMYFKNLNVNKYGCIRSHNAMANEFNRQLKAKVTTLRAELPRAALTYVDIYSAKYQLIRNSRLYGFERPMKICCGHHKNNVHVGCGQRMMINGSDVFGSACGSPMTCISWDGVHYSQAANQWVANQILNGSFSDPPVQISSACLKH